ncbi:RagB/SusD family nutrient uptake outer membrane protein [Niabella aurantiaca]|uniref:RagB/SusD family nutrient uptake outer membrane protein n=1 Tax=Niabella aurantiaca TaxID=379900 RepID=UPI00036F181C|nr:RagB/SusD family nutrient uptake outer membrane protein [Niabella aurantiaca]
MKKFKLYILSFLLLGASCSDKFLDELPADAFTEGTAFISYDNFKTYSWSLYEIFSDPSHLQRIAGDITALPEGDVEANYLYNSNGRNRWAWQTVTAETPPAGWNFAYIRKVNIMLRNIDRSAMTEPEKEHWRAVGLFFRSFHYMELLSKYGDVPWLEDVVEEDQTDVIYGPRTPRDEVAANILRDLQFAENKIKPGGDGDNTINKNCVLALISRFGLREGTWRKYHGLPDSERYLKECERASALLMTAFPTVAADFQHRWSTEDLRTYPGMILFKEYASNVIMQPFSRSERGGSNKIEMHARTIERYLCSDGKPIGTSIRYEGAATMNDEFRNRDYRLLYRIIPPYKVNRVPGGNVLWTYTNNPADREYIDLMNSLDPTGLRPFPVLTWQPFTIDRIPHITGATGSLAPMSNNCGYYFYMCYNTGTDVLSGGSFATTDIPIFHIEEVLLNYAEAIYELGKFSQPIADQTINKLRPRAHVANMIVAAIGDDFDPNRDPEVPPVLWEIRRERMAELMGEGFGFDDIRRWKRAGYFINAQPLGVRMPKAGTPAALKWVTTGADAGRCYRIDDPLAQAKGWKDYYYLYPIPLTETVLNDKLKQNTGW